MTGSIRLADIEGLAQASHLAVFGVVTGEATKGAPEGTRSVVLLGPHEPGFWAHFTGSPEYQDGAADPMDRWSMRVITALADEFGATPVFPFGGPPYAPFQSWAIASGRAWTSPVNFLVHDVAGLWVSFRGALDLPYEVEAPTPGPRPCDTCADTPCLTACPVGALTDKGYDLPACHAYLDGPGQHSCMTSGCQVRASCPAGQGYARVPAQSAFHMGHFHR